MRVRVGDLRDEISSLIRENDVGMAGYGSDVGPMMGGYGFMNYGGSLKNIFVDPFLDVFKTAAGVGKTLAARTQYAARVAIEASLSSIIPLYETRYSEIFKQMSKSVDAVKKKYEDVYKRNDEAFMDKDARFLAFVLDPSSFITSKVVTSSPAIAVSVLKPFVESTLDVSEHLVEVWRYVNELAKEVKGVPRYQRHVGARLRRQANNYAARETPWEGRERPTDPILEAPQAAPQAPQAVPQQTTEQKLRQALSNPLFAKELAATPLAQRMQADGKQLLGTLTGALSKDIADVSKIQSMDDVVRMSNGAVKPPQGPEAEQIDPSVVQAVKGSLSEFYKRSLNGAIQEASNQGMGPETAYVRTLRSLLSKVGT